MEKQEYRNIEDNITASESRTVEGYALVFESPSVDLGFTETIKAGAVDEDTIKRSDVLCRFNHNSEKILARSKNGEGSLLLEVDEKGLHYMFESPNTEIGDELLEMIHRGDLRSSSFAFTVSKEPNSEKWYKRDGKIYRDIYKVDKLYDVAPCYQPAYLEATCSARYAEVKQTSEEIDGQMNLLKEEIEKL